MLENNPTLKIIESISSNKDLGVIIRKLSLLDRDLYILYVQEITDRNSLSSNIIKPILENKNSSNLDIKNIANSIIYVDNIFIDNDENIILDYILKGNSIVLSTNEKQYIVANTIKIEKRNVEKPELQSAIKAPRDAFTENFEGNLSLIRYRIKDPNLMVHKTTVGIRSKTSIAVIYIKDVADNTIVNEVINRINSISIDGVMESGYIQKLLTKNNSTLFPQTGISERSESACHNILNGKICIIVEGGNLPIVLPQTFWDFIDTGDDHYKNTYFAAFIKILRSISLFMSITLSALYIAVVSFHPDILPPQYILTLAKSRGTVPANSFLEAFIMETIAEILKEASLRLPSQIASTIGIVGTIVIGQASITAGLVSPLMLIIVSLSTMTSFIVPDYTITNSLRVLKFMLIFITASFGLLGLIIGITFIIINLVSTTSFGVPYTSPFIPLNFKDIKNYFLSDIKSINKRPHYASMKNRKRK
ncbi:spore germination protein [Clostridium tetanomorphum]|uniref:Spore germination protein n=1 Tax=Clostridium tetanomorphum TaxID=1553 RepID=A0A923EB64_CLOTT|nr:spore germination protein [Clostridium tetanomorphum]MBC2398466.1 spore germination protein [Clostridium tetanomorphum]NRZ98411.1 hypothetical protein [Clostridium tetanomorphum]